MAPAPADSPKTVTFAGSPPNVAISSCTQRRVATLVEQAAVGRRAVELRVALDPDPVVGGHHHHSAPGQRRAVVVGLGREPNRYAPP